MAKIENIPDTSDKKCICSNSKRTWIDHWGIKKGRAKWIRILFPPECKAKGCWSSADVGAHVRKIGAGDKKHYIVPLCHKCNRKEEAFEIATYDLLVSAVC